MLIAAISEKPNLLDTTYAAVPGWPTGTVRLLLAWGEAALPSGGRGRGGNNETQAHRGHAPSCAVPGRVLHDGLPWLPSVYLGQPAGFLGQNRC